MSTQRRTIVLSVQDDFSRQLREFARQMDSAADATTQLGRTAGSTGGLGQMAFSLNQIFGAAQQVYGTFQMIYSTAREWADMGVAAQRSAMALEAFAGSAQEAARWTEAVREGARGTITEGEAAAKALQLMRFGLADSAEAAGEFTRVIDIVAALNPQLGGVDNAISQIQLTMANMSYMRLDQLGISVSFVKDRMKELRDETAGMSEEAAFQQAVLEGLKRQADVVGDDIFTLTSNQDQLNSKLREFKELVGTQVNIALEGFAGLLLDAANNAGVLYGYLDEILRITREQGLAPVIAAAVGAEYYGPQYTEVQNLGPVYEPTQTNQALQYWRYGAMVPNRSGFMQYQTAFDFMADVMGYSDYAMYNPASRQAQQQQMMEQIMRAQGAGAGGRGLSGMGVARPGGAIPWMIWETSQLADRGAGMATEAGANLLSVFQGAASAAADMMGSVAQIGKEGEIIVTQWDSLAQKFGTDQAAAFDVDVLNEMADSLRNVGVEAEVADQAIRAYEWATGMATGASTLFDERLDMLTQRFADGQFTATEYVNAVRELGTLDYSWVDRLTQGMDYDTAKKYIDAIAELTSFSGFQGGGMTQEEANPWLFALGIGGGAEDDNMFQPIIDDADMTVGDIRQRFEEGGGEWSAEVTSFVDLSGQEFGRFKEDAIREIRTINKEMEVLWGTERTFTITVSGTGRATEGSGGTTGSYEATAFAGGGYTGAGREDEPAGIVHRGEYVVPSRGALVMRGGGDGGGGGEVTVSVPVYLDGEKVAEIVERVANRRGRTIYTPGWVAGQRS